MRGVFGLALIALLLTAAPAAAQNQIDFGGIRADTTLPVEVTSDSLEVRDADGTAVFEGNVVVVQGEMRLAAKRVEIIYAAGDRKTIERMTATGGVTLVSGPDAAESREAVYTIASGLVVMTGDVLLTQGPSVISGQKLNVDLKTGTGSMEGRVKTVLRPGEN